MALSHLRVQIRWLASKIRFCSSSVLPLVSVFLLCCVLFSAGTSGCELMLSIPRIVPIVMAGHERRSSAMFRLSLPNDYPCTGAAFEKDMVHDLRVVAGGAFLCMLVSCRISPTMITLF